MSLSQSTTHPIVWRLTGGDWTLSEALELVSQLRSLLRRGLVLSEAEQDELATLWVSSVRHGDETLQIPLRDLAYQAAAHARAARSLPDESPVLTRLPGGGTIVRSP